jgi:hypothetical protein
MQAMHTERMDMLKGLALHRDGLGYGEANWPWAPYRRQGCLLIHLTHLWDKTVYLAQDKSPHRGLGFPLPFIRHADVVFFVLLMALTTDVVEEVLILKVAEFSNARLLKDLVAGIKREE